MVGQDKDRRMVGWLVAPPPSPALVPLAIPAAEHLAAHDVGAITLQEPVNHIRIRAARPARFPLLPLPARRIEHPLMQAHAPLADRILDALVGPATIFADGRKDMRMAQEEIFGPSTLVLPVSNLDEALDVANSTQYGLSMSIYTNDLRKAFHAMEEMQSGIVYVNAPTIGAEIQLPFGGVKNTGNGHREAGTVALDEFTEWKTIYVDYSGRLQRAQIDTGE